jgi:hypothetical protein
MVRVLEALHRDLDEFVELLDVGLLRPDVTGHRGRGEVALHHLERGDPRHDLVRVLGEPLVGQPACRQVVVHLGQLDVRVTLHRGGCGGVDPRGARLPLAGARRTSNVQLRVEARGGTGDRQQCDGQHGRDRDPTEVTASPEPVDRPGAPKGQFLDGAL